MAAATQQALAHPAPAVKEQRLAARLRQHTWSEAIYHRLRAAGAEQGYTKAVGADRALRSRIWVRRQNNETGDN